MQLQYVSNGLQSVVVIKDKKVIFIKIQALVQDQLLQFTVDRIFKKDSELIDYRIDSVTEGTDAQARFMLSLLLKINMLMV